MKRYGCVVTLFGVVGLITILFIALRPQPHECLRFGQTHLQAGDMPLPNNLSPLQGTDLKGLRRIVRLSNQRILASPFTLTFSEDDSLLAISGVGYASAMVVTTLLWKLNHAEFCVLEVGDYSVDSYSNRFVAFSPDSQFVLLNKCLGALQSSTRCLTLWDTQYNQSIDRFYDAEFVRQENEILLEYQYDQSEPIQTSRQRWQAIDILPPPLRVIVEENTLYLIDRETGRKLRIRASGRIHDFEFSHDGKLLALAISQPGYYAPYFHSTYVELWGVTDTTAEIALPNRE